MIPEYPVVENAHVKEHPRYTFYLISTRGDAWHLYSHDIRTGKPPEWRKLKATRRTDGYYKYSVFQDGQSRSISVHMLVLETFVGPRKRSQQCRHLDGNPANNCLENLAWGTIGENARDRRLHGTIRLGSDHANAVLTEDQIHMIRGLKRNGATHNAIAEHFGISKPAVQGIIHKRNWSQVSESDDTRSDDDYKAMIKGLFPILNYNGLTKCRHSHLTVSEEFQSVTRWDVSPDGVFIAGSSDPTPTGSIHVACHSCGFRTKYTPKKKVPAWLRGVQEKISDNCVLDVFTLLKGDE